MTGLTESVVDDTAIEKFKDLGYGFAYRAEARTGCRSRRMKNHDRVILQRRLQNA